MSRALRLKVGRHMVPVPRWLWRRRIARGAREIDAGLAFMTADHHRVRNFAVVEVGRTGASLSADAIAERLELPVGRVASILDELERNLTFLYRSDGRTVDWAYPVTAAATPHRLVFANGERMTAAWAVDAFATPFVQGRLRGEPMAGVVHTACACCGEPIEIEIDAAMRHRVLTAGARPLISSPLVDFAKLRDPSITDAFWRRSVFFWSEEHARKHRLGTRATYPTPAQLAYWTPIIQGALFPVGPGD